MKFARSAKWLTHIFTPSVTPPSRYPDRFTDDVSLVQPYDGGGWGFAPPESWILVHTSAVIAGATETILTVGAEEIFRLIAASAVLEAGVAPTVVLLVQAPDAANQVGISNVITPNTAQNIAFSTLIPILGPTHRLQVNWDGGDAATQIRIRVYGCRLPLGVSPTI